MFITKKDAATVYAAACRKWYGTRAKSVIKSKIRRLKAKGNLKGVAAWQLVADELSHGGRKRPMIPAVCPVKRGHA
jgi:hypothetical protein